MIDRTKLRDNIFFYTFEYKAYFNFCSVLSLQLLLFLIAMRSANLLSYNQQIEKEAEIRNIAIRITNDIQRDNLNSGNIEQIIPKIESIQQDNRNINF